MALELNKLAHAVNDLSANAAHRLAELDERLPEALERLNNLGAVDEALRRKVQAAIKFRWAGAIPTDEAVNGSFPLPPHPARVNLLAADGSQIYPDRHGVALYYLINIGSLVFRHGTGGAPLTYCLPEVFFEDADLYEEDGGQVPSAMIDAWRDIRELGELARLAQQEAPSAPTVALLDNGLLLYFSLQSPDEQLTREVIRDYLARLDQLRASGAAVAGVVDRPRASGVIRLLLLSMLDEINEAALRDLGPFRNVTDAMLFDFLQPGERSAVFESGSPANQDRYKPARHTIYFFYLNTGRPGNDALLRVEVPEWVAQDRAKLDLVHTAIVEQCRVSDGFPYVLIRAHELAVVSLAERREFDQMVIGALIRRGLRPSLSHKAQGKAWTGGVKRKP
jgi:hypothetical protein